MDRGKPIPGARGPKNKITQQPPDLFIALGSKQSSSRDDPKRPVPLPKPSTSHLPSTSSKGNVCTFQLSKIFNFIFRTTRKKERRQFLFFATCSIKKN